jgi:hypothetical protein
MNAIYVSVNSFKVAGDSTTAFNTGRRLKLDCGGDGVKYAKVVSSSYSNPYTTVTIDESTLTSNLTDAKYGVVSAGTYGSIPDHAHDGSEGSGGLVTISGGGGASSFLQLTDTPSSYDGGKYLRSTASGTEWATVSGGTGGATTLLELTDTPTTYSGSEGKYLRVTASGIEFTEVSSGGQSSTLSGTSLWVDGDATVTGTMYAHVYDSYSPLTIKDGGVTVIEGDGTGNINLKSGTTLGDLSIAVSSDTKGIWYYDSGEPSVGLGQENDFYLNSDNLEFYRKDLFVMANVDTSAATPTFTTGNGDLSNPGNCIDGNENTYEGGASYYPEPYYFEIDFGSGNSKELKEIIYIAEENTGNENARTGYIYARESTEDSWTSIKTIDPFVQQAGKQTKTETFLSNTTAYRYWRLGWQKNGSWNMNLKLYEVYYRTSADPVWGSKGYALPTISGSEGKYLRATASGTEWATVSGGTGGASTFLDLTDTPTTYSGSLGRPASVSSTTSGIVFDELTKTWVGDGSPMGFAYHSESYDMGAGTDDGYAWSTSSFDNTSTTMPLGYSWDQDYHFFRYPSLPIGDNATITNAYIKFTAASTTAGMTTTHNIWCSDEDDAAAPTSKADLTGRPDTIAATAWPALGTWNSGSKYDTPNFASSVQEVVDRTGWEEDNAIMVVIRTSGASGAVNIYTYNHSEPTYRPKLYLEWNEPINDFGEIDDVYWDKQNNVAYIKEGVGDWKIMNQSLIGLSDTPTTYSGAEGKYLRATASGTEWATVSGGTGGASTFLDLTDTPTTYSGADGKYLRVTSSGVEFADVMEGKSSWEVQAGAPTGSSEEDNFSFDKESKGVYIYVPTYEYRDNVKLLLDFNGDFSDSSDSGHTMSEFGDVFIDTTNKKFGTGSAYFDGTGDYLQAPSSSDFDLSASNWTIECWIRHANVGSYDRTIWAPNSNYDGIGVKYDNSRLKYYISSNGSNWNIVNDANGSKTSWSSGVWYHVAVTWDGSAYRGFVDGVLDVTINSSTGIYSGFTPRIGCWDNGTGFWYGNIDQFIVYKGVALYTSNFTPATSPIEITDDTGWQLTGTMAEHKTVITTFSGLSDTPSSYEEGKYLRATASGTEWAEVQTPASTFLDLTDTPNLFIDTTTSGVGPSLLLHMEGTNGSTTITDSSTESHTMTNTASNYVTISTAFKKFGSASAYFSGANDAFITSDANYINLNATPWTIDYWVYWDTTVDDGCMVGAQSDGIIALYKSGNNIIIYLGNGGWNILVGNSFGHTWSADTWYHIAMTWDLSNYRIFIDGIKKLDVSNSNGMNPNWSPRIGAWGNATLEFTGYIDEFRVIKQCLWTDDFSVPTEAGSPYAAELPVPFTKTQFLTINDNADALEYRDFDFTQLNDTPTTYSGSEGKYLRATASGTEWAEVSSGEQSSTLSGTSLFVDGDATVTGTMYAHVYDSYSPLIIKDGGVTVISGSGDGTIDFPQGSDKFGNTCTIGASLPEPTSGFIDDIHFVTTTEEIYQKTSETIEETGDLTTGGTASASDFLGGYPPSYAFDGSGNFWVTTSLPQWLQYEFSQPEKINKIRFYPRQSNAHRMPSSFSVKGSTTGVFGGEEVTIASFSGLTYANYTWTTVTFSNENYYKYYRLYITSAQSGSEINMVHCEMIGYAPMWTLMGTYVSELPDMVTTFSGLSDTPSSYDAGKYLRATASGTEWAEVSGGSGSSTFIDLTDTPSTYSGTEGQYLKTTSSGIEFVDHVDTVVASGIVLRAPDNGLWWLKVTNSGTLYTEAY